MTLIEALKILKESMETTVTAAVKVLRGSVFKVDIGRKRFEVANFPKTQAVEGKVTVVNQKELEKQIGEVSKRVQDVHKALDGLRPLKQVEVTNFPAFPKPPEPPKTMEISKPIKVSPESLSSIVEAISKLREAVSRLPTKYPEVKIPPFPKVEIPPFPKIPQPPTEISVNNLERLISDDPKRYIPVRLSDGKEFYRALEELAVSAGRSYAYSNSQGVKQQALVDQDRHVQVDLVNSLDRYRLNDKYTDGNTTYTGNEAPNGDWYIMKSVSGSVGHLRYATHKNNPTISTYVGAWNNKATLTYGYVSDAFDP